jgi:asparagine synthase (glutamine-hydrolysing)
VSGFAGIVRIAPSVESAEADRSAIELMAHAIAFRGPDAQQQTHQPGASFAYSLLITGAAPQSSSQPVTIDGAVWLVGDVRLDRRNELIDKLDQHGLHVRSGVTDEEIVLIAWRSRREEKIRRFFFEQIYGDFSFVLWEPSKRELHCFRDVMGVRPCYYCAGDGVFSFSNTLSALHNAPGFSQELDREYIGDFLLHSWCPRPEHTVYRSIRRVPAGHWLTFSPVGLQVRRFQGLPVEEPLFLKREEEYVEIYRDLLGKAVEDRLPQGPASIFLSGGMDSGTIAATVCAFQKHAGEQRSLHAFSADMQALFDDEEGQWAAKVAGHLGIRFELSHHGDCTPFSGLQEFGTRFPEPVANPFRAIYLHLYRRCAVSSRVVFLGYGGDDILTGRTGTYFAYLARRGRFTMALKAFAGYLISKGSVPPLRVGVQSWLRRCFGLAEPEPQFPTWLASEFEKKFDLRTRWQQLQRREPTIHPIHATAYRGLAGAYWPHTLDQQDAAYTGLPLEVRLPFFDYRLLCFLLRLPSLPWCVDKEIMRRAMQGVLPETILKRSKQPLVQDPLLVHVHKGTWRVDGNGSPGESIEEFVNWKALQEHGQARSDLSVWACVPPIALDLWLKRVDWHK